MLTGPLLAWHRLTRDCHLSTVDQESEQVAKIADYGVIGDCRAAALVSRYGSLDWLCWPRFDSPSIFAAILDRDKGGHWSIRPSEAFRVKREYVHDTNVLETEFITSSGRATLMDLMPVASEEFKRRALVPDHEIVRQVLCMEGEVRLEVEFYPRANYGSQPVRIRERGKLGMKMDVGRGAYWLRSTIRLHSEGGRATASIRLKRGEWAQFSFSYTEEAPAVLPALGEATQKAVERSIAWWQAWAARSKYEGPYRDAVVRSALTLKLLSYSPSGAIAAAATTSLPERIGGSLNWDYRYCWLRDASLAVRAMLGLGYREEVESFLSWLLHATRLTQPELRVLYSVFGQIAPRERELAHLSGYAGSRPVRVGNGARQQIQLDIYGEVIDAAAQCAEHVGRFDRTTQRVLVGLGKYVAQNWDRPDEGIWEPRSGQQHHTHSRLMCWTALDRLLALGDKGILEGAPRDVFRQERDCIKQQIQERAWNEDLQSYVSVLDGSEMDATLLRLAWYGLEHADSDRMKKTYRRVREKLRPRDSLLYRYERNPPEGAFGVCGFWGVEQLALGGGTLEQAHDAFRQLLAYQNDLGLYAEEIDPESGEELGNMPQAFTHVGLISAALTLAEQERGKPHPAMQVGSDVKPSRTKART
ncbi:MAG TPA: glycoside hydrolase family 15 protein [Terriglobales bacterium]